MSRFITGLFAFTLISSLVLATAWLTRHSWLTHAAAHQATSAALKQLGLSPLAAQRADLLKIVSHAKLHNSQTQRYQILGRLYNPLAVPLQNPNIQLLQIDRDNKVLSTQTFSAAQWQLKESNNTFIEATELLDFKLELSQWPENSWGYQLQLQD